MGGQSIFGAWTVAHSPSAARKHHAVGAEVGGFDRDVGPDALRLPTVQAGVLGVRERDERDL